MQVTRTAGTDTTSAAGTPASFSVPRDYNAAADFIDRHLAEGRAGKTAVIDDAGRYTYGELAERASRVGNALRGLGLRMEDRFAMCMLDTIQFPAVFWGGIKAGLVPIPLNTLLTTKDYAYMLRDSRVRALVVSEALYDKIAPALEDQPFLEHVIVDGAETHGRPRLADLMASASDDLAAAPTTCDDVAFWLYSSGSTGAPKGVMHCHSHLAATHHLFGQGVLGVREDDVVFSAAKLFFAYGLGNGMTFPFGAGATVVLLAERPTPESVMRTLGTHEPTIYCGVPTLYSAILADKATADHKGSPRLRLCVSAGEALPAEVGQRWEARFGVEILDGLGSTEMLHIFLCNPPGKRRYGTSGIPVPGYELEIVDEDGKPVGPGEIGELIVRGPSAAQAYWNQREKSRHTFRGAWTYTGDKYTRDEDGYYTYAGRADDMLKVSGNWVSPFEVEGALVAHDAVLEAAVVGDDAGDGLVKPHAFVVLKEGVEPTDALADELKAFVKARLAPYKYPRWIDFVDSLPKTATGKIQRFKLRNELEGRHA